MLRPLQGPLASGRKGDFFLSDRHLKVVVRGLGAVDAGALIDAVAAKGLHDALGSLMPVIGLGDQLAAPTYRRLFIERDALGGAGLRLTGYDRQHPQVAVVVRYRLRDDGTVQILTSVTNRGRRALTGYRICDRIDWGRAAGWVPGFGFLPREPMHADWIGAIGTGTSYAYRIGSQQRLSARFDHPPGTAEIELRRIPQLVPGEPVLVERALAVASGGQLGRALTHLFGQDPAGRVEVAIIAQSREPVAGAQITFERSGRPYARVVAGDDGRATISLPPDDYRVRGVGNGQSTGWHPLRLTQRAESLSLRTGPPSQLVFEVRQQNQVAGPARLTIEGLGETPSPWLGPPHELHAGNTLITTSGKGIVALPPGRYRVTVSRGPLHSVAVEELTLRPFEGASLVARIAPVVDPAGFVAVDLAQDVIGDGNCGVSPKTRASSSSAEGLAIIALHGTQDTTPRLHRVVSDDESAEGLNTLSAPGARPFREWAPCSASVDAPPPEADGMRLLDGRYPGSLDQRLKLWLQLLAGGRRITATAASASQRLWRRPPGYPRTYVATSSAQKPAELLESLRRGAAVISTGPLIRLSVGGKGPGERLTARTRRGRKISVDVEVTVLAPDWVPANRLELLVNGELWDKSLPIPSTGNSGIRLEHKLTLPLERDSFIVAVVRSSGTLAAIGAALPSIAITNPVWVEMK